MLVSALAAAFTLALGARAQAEDPDLVGTWSSGSGAVVTGGNFCSPQDMTFSYPNNTGISYSFTEDGFFEEAQYRYDSNATNPNCIRGKIIWQHGTYKIDGSGQIVMTPFPSDGRIQVQDPCAAETNVVTWYNEVVTFKAYAISTDPVSGNQMLQANAFDGAKLPPMYLAFRPPNMLPTKALTGTNETGQLLTKRDTVQKRNGADAVSMGRLGLAGAVLATTALSFVF